MYVEHWKTEVGSIAIEYLRIVVMNTIAKMHSIPISQGKLTRQESEGLRRDHIRPDIDGQFITKKRYAAALRKLINFLYVKTITKG